MIDYNKHAYSKIGSYSNVLYQWAPSETERAATWTIHMHHKMASIIHKLAMAHPDWTFVMQGGGSDIIREQKTGVHTTHVLCDGEVIGTMGIDLWKSGNPYEISCPAINASRQRGRGAWTTKPEKAYKLVEQNFRPRSIVDRFKAGRSELRGKISSVAYGERRVLANTMEKLGNPLVAYIVNNMDTVKAALPVSTHANLDVIPSLAKRVNESEIVANAVTYDRGAYVMIRDGKYYVLGAGDENYSVLAPEELPEDMAAKLGMLKAFDTNDEILEGVGMRSANGIYFIL